MKFISSFCLLLLGALFIYGCSDSGSPGVSGTIQQLFPLKYGNYWTYRLQEFDTNGNSRRDTTITMEVHGTRDTLGKTLYQVVAFDDASEFYYERNRVYIMRNPPELFLQYPMSPGQEVINLDTVSITTTDTTFKKSILKCESNNDLIDLGFEKFTCSRYRISDSYTSSYYFALSLETVCWFALNKGIIMQENYDISNGSRILTGRLELLSYHVN